MDFLRWIPLVLVLPGFGFIGYWMWRHRKAIGLGRLPRTLDEVKRVDAQFKQDSARAVARLRWFNLCLMLGVTAVLVIWSFLSRR